MFLGARILSVKGSSLENYQNSNLTTHTGLKISEFVLDKKFQRKASKFVIFYTYTKNQCYFSPNKCPGLCQHRPGQGISLGEKNKVAQNEKRKKQLWVSVYVPI